MLSVYQKQALSLNESDKPGLVVHLYRTQEIQAGDCKLQANLDYIVRPWLKKTKGDGGEMFELVGMLAAKTHTQPELRPCTLHGGGREPTPLNCPDCYTYFCTYTYKINKKQETEIHI